MKREACIESIADILPKEEGGERPEKAYDQIAWACLQITPNGTYVDHSLSISTIIWSMNQIKNSKERLSKSIDAKAYHETVERIEKKFFSKGYGINQKAENESIQLDEYEEDAFISDAAYA